MKILRHRKLDDGSFQLAIWINETKVIAEDDPRIEADVLAVGDPDPDFVRRFEWAPRPDDFGSGTQAQRQNQYVQMMLREAKLLIEHEQAQQGAPSEGQALPSEGDQL